MKNISLNEAIKLAINAMHEAEIRRANKRRAESEYWQSLESARKGENMLYKMVELPSDEPVQFVGVYVLKWGHVDEPTVAFRKATPEEIAAEQGVQADEGRADAPP